MERSEVPRNFFISSTFYMRTSTTYFARLSKKKTKSSQVLEESDSSLGDYTSSDDSDLDEN